MKHQTNKLILSEQRPRQLRHASTDVERIIWQQLRGRQIGNAKFRRQHAIGDYIVDFVSFDAMLIIELDGGQHQSQMQYDERRDQYLHGAGFQVVRLWNNDVLTNLDGVMETIFTAVATRATP
ncbi:MAG: endonuclease domain-containing protein [Aeromicrobium sp.]|nr:endonuclease domain-containing protein [Burkholderiales bacterium]